MAYNRVVTSPTLVKLSAFGYPGWEADDEGDVYWQGAIIIGFISDGRVYVKANNQGKIKRSQIVCTAWHGPRPSNLHGALHKNDIKSDDRPSNLYWGTNTDNVRDALANGSHRSRGGVLCVDDVIEIRKTKAEGILSYHDIAEIYGVSHKTIRNVVNRVTWGHVK